MELSKLEKVIGYTFKNEKLLEEALTHPSCNNRPQLSYNRLEFLGDAVIGVAIAKYFFETYPNLSEDQLTDLRAANVSTEKFARVAVRHGLYPFLRHSCRDLDPRVKRFEDSVMEEVGLVVHGGFVQAESVLADIVESVAGAIFIDNNSDLVGLWEIIGKLLEPIFTPEDLKKNPHPVTRLQHFCDKEKKKLEYCYGRDDSNSTVRVLVDGCFITSASANKQDAAKLIAAIRALDYFNVNTEAIDRLDSITESVGIENAKQNLQQICQNKGWPLPIYNVVEETGPDHDKRYVSVVKIETDNGEKVKRGDAKRRKCESEKSAALSMIGALRDKPAM